MHPILNATSPKDFDTAITNQVIHYNCVVCRKPVERKFRRTRIDTFKRMMCLECNMSYLASLDPGKFQRSLEANRRNHGGFLSSQIDMSWNKAGVEKNKSIEGRKLISDRIKNNPELLESKKICYFGVNFDSIPELCVYIFCNLFGIPIFRNCREIGLLYKDSLGYQHTVYPDFIINGRIVEIKGKQFYNPDGSWTMPFKKDSWDDERYNYECDKMECKRKCLIDNKAILLKDTDTWVQQCVSYMYLVGINPRDYIYRTFESKSYGYTPFNIKNTEYQDEIIYVRSQK